MPGGKYEQLPMKSEGEEDVFTSKPKAKWSEICFQKSLLSLGLILLYFSLSIGLTFYQRWLLTDFKFPLTVVMYHLIVKWVLSVCVRVVLQLITGTPQLILPCMTCLKSVGPTGLASGIDVGFSNWGLELVTISLYTMTKSTTIIFILFFAIVLGLEKKSWSLVGIVLMISAGLIMFTYKATQFNLLGFNFLLIASFAAGLRWTFAQLLMQKSKLGLHNPVDMVFHVQPWMFVSLLPFTIMFEGYSCYDYLQKLSSEKLLPTFLKVSGDVLSPINVVGLAVCLLGICGHIVHKVIFIKSVTGTIQAVDADFNTIRRPLKISGEHDKPLLEDQTWPASEESDFDSNVVLFEVLQRRDGSAQILQSLEERKLPTIEIRVRVDRIFQNWAGYS
ncbi:unnamed protein product [Spodoptera littoralis]|uniref:Sugar phosphate transporter domain-containing protein n=1 Tax=Spodoptera littoralis TaxID=7109 RepID=A0A9P0IIC9_SPOLI|nr:unnamed protein product [Spodoptera littoralis]CAH1647405.1 unnamed protein product [Spodoptera littoralis]